MTYQNTRVIGFSIVTLIVIILLSWFFYKKGSKDALIGSLTEIDNQLATTRSSSENHIRLLATRSAIINKLNSL